MSLLSRCASARFSTGCPRRPPPSAGPTSSGRLILLPAWSTGSTQLPPACRLLRSAHPRVGQVRGL